MCYGSNILQYFTYNMKKGYIFFKAVLSDVQSVNERCGHILYSGSTYQIRKKIHINMCPETFNFQLSLKEYSLDISSSTVICGQGLLATLR
jgi:hypothetical protein